MKIRLGFVSNSSSSSYTCEVCGNTESGYDCSLEEIGMAECENGHTFCKDHLIDWPEPKDTDDFEDEEAEIDDEVVEDYNEVGQNEDGAYNALCCPICQLLFVSKYDRERYLYKITKRTKNDLDKEIKDRFKNYDDFTDFLK